MRPEEIISLFHEEQPASFSLEKIRGQKGTTGGFCTWSWGGEDILEK